MFDRVLDHQAKQVAYNVYSYFKTRKLDKNTEENKSDINIITIVSDATGLSKSSVTRIIREGNAMKCENGVVEFKFKEKKKHIRKKRINVDAYTESVIRRKVIQFYSKKNVVPSVRKLNAALKKENILKCSDEFLRQLLHKLGFSNTDDESPDALIENPEIVAERLKYIRSIKELRDKHRPIFFLNETKRWPQSETTDEFYNGKMPSWVIVHASGRGFKNGKMFMCKSKSDGDQNNKFKEDYSWFKSKIIPFLQPKSVIVINTPYCETPESAAEDEQPTLASQRATIEEWLNRHRIPFKETLPKAELLDLIDSQNENLQYSITKFIEKSGHTLLFLPENHSDLNPATIVWDELKGEVENTPVTQLFEAYSKEKWNKCFKLLKQNEDEYYSQDINTKSVEIEVKKEIENESTQDDNNMACD